jgi:hypothetical protein
VRRRTCGRSMAEQADMEWKNFPREAVAEVAANDWARFLDGIVVGQRPGWTRRDPDRMDNNRPREQSAVPAVRDRVFPEHRIKDVKRNGNGSLTDKHEGRAGAPMRYRPHSTHARHRSQQLSPGMQNRHRQRYDFR